MISRSELARLRNSEKDSETGEIVKRAKGGGSQRQRRRSLRQAKRERRSRRLPQLRIGLARRSRVCDSTPSIPAPPRPATHAGSFSSCWRARWRGRGDAGADWDWRFAAPRVGCRPQRPYPISGQTTCSRGICTLVVADGQRGLLALRHGVLLAGQVTSP